VKLSIDGRDIEARDGETLLDCALRNGIEIPHLCANEGLAPYGGCRMCVVEIEGMRGYPPSCTTPAAEGMVVRTQGPELKKLRRNVLGLMMLEHPNACLLCGRRAECEAYRPEPEKAGRTTGCHTCNNKPVCEVRGLAEELELAELPVPPIYHQRPLERDNPFMDRDLNLCILCGRCVRVCKEQQGRAVIDFVGRGSNARIGQAFDQTLVEAGCNFCGACVDVCPTGTLSDRFAKWYGRPDASTATTCGLCDQGCAMSVSSVNGRMVGARAVDPGVPLCVLGRFAMAEFLAGPDRLHFPYVRVGAVLRQSDWKLALEQAATRLDHFRGETFAFVCDPSSTLEDRRVFERFTRELMGSPHFITAVPDAWGRAEVTLPGDVRAVITTGSFFPPEAAADLEVLVLMDCYPSPLQEKANFVFPAAVLAEVEGSLPDADGTPRPMRAGCAAPGLALPEWRIIRDLAQALGGEALGYESVESIRKEMDCGPVLFHMNREAAPPAALDITKRRRYFRNHLLEDLVEGLQEVPANPACRVVRAEAVKAPGAPFMAPEAPADGRFRIVEKRELIPNTHEIVVHAPEVARKALAGQFAIVMADALSERVPYTLCDWDAEAGTITFVVLEKGQSSRKLCLMEPGECLAHVTGPLGIPLDIRKYGTVVLLGGCYGIGAMYPAARAFREAGNRVVSIAEARSWYLEYHRDKLERVSDEFIQSTMDGSNGVKGHAADVLKDRLAAGEKVDLVVAVGCPFMMMITAQETAPYGIPTLASLNPIMVDGTGMCGACRITVGDQIKFACVDGPFFDAHQIDWAEVKDRRSAYSAAEIQSVGRTASVGAHPRHPGGCGCHA